jgi:hypothetical protein
MPRTSRLALLRLNISGLGNPLHVDKIVNLEVLSEWITISPCAVCGIFSMRSYDVGAPG